MFVKHKQKVRISGKKNKGLGHGSTRTIPLPEIVAIQILVTGIRHTHPANEHSSFGHVAEAHIQRHAVLGHTLVRILDPFVTVFKGIRKRWATEIGIDLRHVEVPGQILSVLITIN
jgi:hypothetical protein